MGEDLRKSLQFLYDEIEKFENPRDKEKMGKVIERIIDHEKKLKKAK